MASSPVSQEMLIDLLLHLKRASPDEARKVLNAGPEVGYHLLPLMIRIGAVNVEVVQRTLSQLISTSTNTTATPTPAVPAPVAPQRYGQPPIQPVNLSQPSMQPPSAIPPHVTGQPNRGNTPPYGHGSPPPHPRGHTPTYGRNAPGYPPQTPVHPGQAVPYPYNAAQPPQPPAYSSQGQPQPPTFNPLPPQQTQLPAAIAAMPEEQKAAIMRIVSMTPEEIQRLPPAERSSYIQIRQALGMPS